MNNNIIDTSLQLIYSRNMNNYDQNDMDIENIPYVDFILNNDEENPNDTIEEMFHYEVEKAIDSGNVDIIKNAIHDYGHLINNNLGT